MKRKNIIFVTLLVLGGLFAIQSCTKVDDTTFVTKQAFTTPAPTSPAVRADGTVLFTGTTVTLSWTSENTGGDAASWKVYFGPGKIPALYQSDVTTTSIDVPVLDGQTYYWRVETTDSRGVVTTSTTNKFIAVNGTNPAITIDLGCTTDVKTAIGVDLAADAVVDLRFLILNKSDLSLKKTVDVGYANESYKDFSTLPDGEYVLGVDIFSSKTFGSIDKPVTLDLSLHFAQLGMINQTLDFPKVMNNVNTCSYYRTLLAEVKKVGAVYTITKSVKYWVDPIADPSKLVGTWKGTDTDGDYVSSITSVLTSGKLWFDNIGKDWMTDYWGEVIVTHPKITMNFNYCAGTILIPNQKIMTTTWKGAAQPAYNIEGSGTFDLSGTYPVLTLHYVFHQSTATWPTDDGGAPYWEAKITLDPAGLKVIKQSAPKMVKRANR